LIIGYGNTLRTDDGVGPHVARVLASRGYNAMEAAQLLPEMAERISRAGLVIFVDCRVDLGPGEIAVVDAGGPPGEIPNLHFLCTPQPVLQLAKQLFQAEPEAFLVGIGPESLDMGEGLTPTVQRAAAKAIEMVSTLVSAHLAGTQRSRGE
jgi:hydrogenase maturation protease